MLQHCILPPFETLCFSSCLFKDPAPHLPEYQICCHWSVDTCLSQQRYTHKQLTYSQSAELCQILQMCDTAMGCDVTKSQSQRRDYWPGVSGPLFSMGADFYHFLLSRSFTCRRTCKTLKWRKKLKNHNRFLIRHRWQCGDSRLLRFNLSSSVLRSSASMLFLQKPQYDQRKVQHIVSRIRNAIGISGGPPLPAHEKWNDLQQRLSHCRDIVAFLEFQSFLHTYTHTHTRTRTSAHILRNCHDRSGSEPSSPRTTTNSAGCSRSSALRGRRNHPEKRENFSSGAAFPALVW